MASIKDIAKKAGVSPSTVSIIINGKAQERKISSSTQKKVLDIMSELKYIPNISAKTMRQGDNPEYIVALFCSLDFRNTMMTRFFSGILHRITENNDNMKIVIYPYLSGHLSNEEKHFLGSGFHAAIVANADEDDLKFLQDLPHHIPIILYNRRLEGFSSVNVDDASVGRIAAEHLWNQGYRRPAILWGNKSYPGSQIRQASFIKVFQELGGQILSSNIYELDNSIRAGAKMAASLTDGKEALPDSVFCSSDNVALGFANQLSRQGISIPSDVGILSIGNIEPYHSEYNNPPLSVIEIPIEKMAECCYDIIKGFQHFTEKQTENIFFETPLIIRESTALSK